MIEVRNLSKRYGDKLAVDGLDFVVQPGVVTGFLGPNGAGPPHRGHDGRGVRGPGFRQFGHRPHARGQPAAGPAAGPGRHHHQRPGRRPARSGPGRGADRYRGLAGTPACLRAVPAAGFPGAGVHGGDPGFGGVPRRRRERRDGGGGMTTMTHAPRTAPVAGRSPLRVTQRRVLLSEWTKFRSLRSTVYTLLAAVVLSIGIGALFSAVCASQYHTFGPADRASFNPISTSLNGMLCSQLPIGVVGVLLIIAEYNRGVNCSSLTS